MKTRCGVVAAFCAVLTGTTAAAQHTGGTLGETVATLRDRDLNGMLSVRERVVTHSSRSGDEEQVISEIYAPSIQAGRLTLSRRVRRVITTTGGGRRTVEEVEARNPVAPSEPLRIVRRSVTTVRQTEDGATASERQIFERDVNGRLTLVRTQTEERSAN